MPKIAKKKQGTKEAEDFLKELPHKDYLKALRS
jgi:hypothetical protein